MNHLERFADINTFVFDVDGVLTNSELIILENGKLLRKMNTRDGYALKHAVQSGYQVVIITGGGSSGVILRLEGLGIKDVFSRVHNKLEVFDDYVMEHDIDPGKVLYMGDDLPDYEVMRRVGVPTCPSDAAHEIIEIAQYISPKKGGEGCVRDVIEKVMRLHGNWLEDSEV